MKQTKTSKTPIVKKRREQLKLFVIKGGSNPYNIKNNKYPDGYLKGMFE